MMEPRLNPFAAAPSLVKQYIDYSQSIIASGLEPDLLHLVEIRHPGRLASLVKLRSGHGPRACSLPQADGRPRR